VIGLFGEARRQYQGPAESHTILTLGRWGSGHDCMQTSHNSMQQVYASHKPQLYTTHHSRAGARAAVVHPHYTTANGHTAKTTFCSKGKLVQLRRRRRSIKSVQAATLAVCSKS
jgi:hypothetical protein